MTTTDDVSPREAATYRRLLTCQQELADARDTIAAATDWLSEVALDAVKAHGWPGVNALVVLHRLGVATAPLRAALATAAGEAKPL